jgi:glutaredoxin
MDWRLLIVLTSGLALVSPAQAERVYKTVDEQGNVTYQSRPSPDGGTVEERDISGGYGPSEEAIALDRAVQYYPVTVYAIKKCSPCNRAKEQLSRRKIPFTEKDPTSDKMLYKELQDLSGGSVVPVITIGDTVVSEYTTQALDEALDSAGYPKPYKENPDEGGEEAPLPAQ